MTTENAIESLSYEQAFAELEQILTRMEQETLDLEQSLALFERGQKLTQYCADRLEKAQLRMQQVQIKSDLAEDTDQ